MSVIARPPQYTGSFDRFVQHTTPALIGPTSCFFFFLKIARPPRSTLFPYPPLFRSKSGDGARRDHWYQEIIRADAQAGAQRTARTHSLAAKAQLALAQPARDAFRAVRLTAPLKKSLAVKRNALESAMDGYRRAAEYQVAEVTTAATYEMAELYGTLAKDILASERPPKLKGDALGN